MSQVQRYWRPAGHESPSDLPYTWSTFGYTYNYDSESYVLSIVDTTPTSRVWWAADTSTGYDYLDRPVLFQKGNAYWTQRTYNATDGTLASIATGSQRGGSNIQSLAYTYDGFGNMLTRADALHHPVPESFSYDSMNEFSGGFDGANTYYPNGNINQKYNLNNVLSSYTYDATHPHAVSTAWGYSMGYDANGNLSSRSATGETWNLRWTGFDKPRWIEKTVGSATNGDEYTYDGNKSRAIELKFAGLSGGAPANYVTKRVYGLGSDLELDYTNTAQSGTPLWKNTTARVYIPAPDGMVGAVEYTPTATGNGVSLSERAEVYHYDQIGSIESITPAFDTSGSLAKTTGGSLGLYSEDAWGQRRNPSTYSGPPTTTDTGGNSGLSPRGFTKHEMLDEVGLVHMNGRIYDPLLGKVPVGRSLSAVTRFKPPEHTIDTVMS